MLLFQQRVLLKGKGLAHFLLREEKKNSQENSNNCHFSFIVLIRIVEP